MVDKKYLFLAIMLPFIMATFSGSINNSPFIDSHSYMSELITYVTYGDRVSIKDKGKTLLKFGQNDDVDSGARETLMELAGTETNESFVATDLITHLVCNDNSVTLNFKIEGHTCSGNNRTFVVQTKSATGQTGVALDTPLCRSTRIINNNGTDMPANSICYLYQGGATTGGVPDTASEVHIMVKADGQTSLKAATALSQYDYMFIDHWTCSINKKTSAIADCYLEVREPGGVFLVRDEMTVGSASSPFHQVTIDPYLIVPKNSDIRIRAISSVNDTSISGAFHGYLACIKGSAGCNNTNLAVPY